MILVLLVLVGGAAGAQAGGGAAFSLDESPPPPPPADPVAALQEKVQRLMQPDYRGLGAPGVLETLLEIQKHKPNDFETMMSVCFAHQKRGKYADAAAAFGKIGGTTDAQAAQNEADGFEHFTAARETCRCHGAANGLAAAGQLGAAMNKLRGCLSQSSVIAKMSQPMPWDSVFEDEGFALLVTLDKDPANPNGGRAVSSHDEISYVPGLLSRAVYAAEQLGPALELQEKHAQIAEEVAAFVKSEVGKKMMIPLGTNTGRNDMQLVQAGGSWTDASLFKVMSCFCLRIRMLCLVLIPAAPLLSRACQTKKRASTCQPPARS